MSHLCHLCPFVVWLVCQQDDRKTIERIFQFDADLMHLVNLNMLFLEGSLLSAAVSNNEGYKLTATIVVQKMEGIQVAS